MRPTGTFTWPAPSRGWMTSGNITNAPLDAAERLDNWFPTPEGARLRQGCTKHATLGSQAVRLFTYVAGVGNKLFASTANDIFDATSPADADAAPQPLMSNLESGDWSVVQFGNAAGTYMVGVNGADHAIYYDGTDIEPVAAQAVTNLPFDALTEDFTPGETVTGGTSGATATIFAVVKTSATAGTLKIGTITSGPFDDNEALTDPEGGAATANIPSGTTSASSITLTGVATTALSQVWAYKQRLFFVEGGTRSVWYLPVDSIGGAASEIDLGPVFRRGGEVLFGANWSLDAGDGLDDKCVFVTTEGEVAIYSGLNPNSASTWALEGVYDVGRPLDKHAHVSIGGELYILTENGVAPLSKAIARGMANLSSTMLSYPIETEWQNVIGRRDVNEVVAAGVWRSEGWMIVRSPRKADGVDAAFVCNMQTGSWARYLGWDVRSVTEHNNAPYYCDAAGIVYRAENGGNDAGVAYTATYIPKFSTMGVTELKFANHVNLIARTNARMSYSARVFSDYLPGTIPAPNAPLALQSGMVWGDFNWGEFTWGDAQTVQSANQWKSAGNSGFSLSPGVAVTSNAVGALAVEILATQVRYEVGAAL